MPAMKTSMERKLLYGILIALTVAALALIAG